LLVLAQTSDGAAALGGFVLLVLILIGVAAYFIPTIVAFVKKTPNKMSVLVINLFLGWSFIGWVVALAMAFRDTPAQQQVVIYTQPGEHRLQPQPPPPASPTSQRPPTDQ